MSIEERTKRQRISRLLIVEDDESQLRSLTAIMESEGFEVVGCSNASDALERLRVLDVGVAVLDLRLPDMSGTELLQRLRAYCDRVRLIINTGYSSFDTAKEALNLGAFAYVEKAGDPDELVRHVHRAFKAGLQSYADELEEAVAERTRNLLEVNEALEDERYKLREYFENLPALAYNITFDGKIEDCNQVAVKTLGYDSKDDLIGKPFLTTIYPPSSRKRARELFEKWKREGKVKKEEIQVVTKQGELVDVLLDVTTILDHNGERIHSLSTQTVITERKKAERERLEYQARLKAMASRLSRVQELERRKLSMRLHDSISQSLAVARLSLQQSAQSITDGALAAKLDEISTEIRRIMEDSYSLMLELSNPILYELGLVTALKALLESRFLQDHGIKCKLRACEERLSLSRDTKVTLYQAIRELLVNSAKHGKAENIEVLIVKDADCLRIRVKDDGVGFEASEVGLPGATGGFGLFNVRESLEGIGGVLKIESKAGRGTVAEITVPVKCESRV